MTYQSPLLAGVTIPLARRKRHKEAWEHKKNGRYKLAAGIWREMLICDSASMSLREQAATRQQLAVSYRGLWQLFKADKQFRIAYSDAVRADDVELKRSITIDHTAVFLDCLRPRPAIRELEFVLQDLDESHPQRGQVESYLGRSYGRLLGKKNRLKARQHLFEAFRHLNDNEQRLDALLYALEIFFGRDRRQYRDKALAIIGADESLSGRRNDVLVIYVGFWPLRHAARWAMAMWQRLMS